MKFIYKIFLSLALAFITLLVLQECTRFGLMQNRDFKISYIQRSQLQAGMLVHGPCESEWMIDPGVINKYLPVRSYNLSLNHSDFADNYLFLVTYLKNQKKPKAVLLYVTPESFDSTVANTFNTYRFAHILNDAEVARVVKEMDPGYYTFSFIPFLRFSYYSNFIFYKALSGFRDFFAQRIDPRTINGHINPDHGYHRAFKNFRDLNPKEGTFKWTKSREKYFLKIVELLRKEGVQLIVYESPVYYEALAYQKNREERLNRIDSICNLYQIPNFRFDTLSMRFDKSNYFTTYNMTMAGNAIFNPILGKFLQDTLPSIISQPYK